MAEKKQKADVSKLWIVKDYKSYRDDDVTASDPEKILLCEWSREEDSTTPNDKFKEFLGIIYEHEGFLGDYASPLVTHMEVNGLVNKLMTFVEATVADKEQKEATKKLITRTVWDHFNEINKNVEISLERAKEVKNIR